MNKITVIGIGAGDINQLPLGVYRTLKSSAHLFLRTKEHPVIEELENEGITYTSFDGIYKNQDTFDDVYEQIVDMLISQAKENDIVYCVPGHPFVAERTVQLLLEKEAKQSFLLDFQGGHSFIDSIFTALQIDPIEGLQFINAEDFDPELLQLRQHIIICQVYSPFVASDVKLSLMEKLPDDYEIKIVSAAGSVNERILTIPLYELDRQTEINNLTSVYVPPVQNEKILSREFSTLRKVIATLRGPNGCPWDKKQTHQSLKKYLVEETYEVLDAIDSNDEDGLIEELGDILLQVMLHAQIGEDEGMFIIDDVISSITEKMIRRHPHVFGSVEVNNADQVVENWEQIKKLEKGDEPESILQSIPKGLPSLYRALELQKKAAKVGFDWPDVKPIWDKVHEELKELQEEINSGDNAAMEAEFGDVLFALTNVARYYKLDPEEAIRRTNRKFLNRFQYIEEQIKQSGVSFSELTLDDLDKIWEEAKENNL